MNLRRKSSILKSVITKYIILLFFPTLFIWIFCIHGLHQKSVHELIEQQQTQLENSYNILQTLYTKIDDTFSYVQGNRYLLEYLSGYYRTDADMVYNFIKYIRPFFEEIENTSTDFSGIKLYSSNPSILKPNPEMESMDNLELTAEQLEQLERQSYGDILWVIDHQSTRELPVIKGYKKIYDSQYYNCLGYMELLLSSTALSDFLSIQADSDSKTIYLFLNYEPIYISQSGTAEDICDSSYIADKNHTAFCTIDSNYYANSLYLGEIGLSFVSVGKTNHINSLLNNGILTGTSLLIGVLFLMSLIFFISMTKLPHRILRFSRHMQNASMGTFEPFLDDTGTDELHTLICTYNSMIKKNTELIQDVHKLELLNRDARFAALQAQIHPHFIYGTLESIRMLALQNDDFDVEEMILAFSKLIRYSLSGSSTVTLQKEVEQIHYYLSIQKIRFADRLTYQEEILCDISEVTCPAFILQPLLENALAHAISKVLSPCFLTLSITQVGTKYQILVTNNGAVPTPERIAQVNDLLSGKISLDKFQNSDHGFALYNVNQRLKTFFGPSATLQLHSENGITYTKLIFERKLQ